MSISQSDLDIVVWVCRGMCALAYVWKPVSVNAKRGLKRHPEPNVTDL